MLTPTPSTETTIKTRRCSLSGLFVLPLLRCLMPADFCWTRLLKSSSCPLRPAGLELPGTYSRLHPGLNFEEEIFWKDLASVWWLNACILDMTKVKTQSCDEVNETQLPPCQCIQSGGVWRSPATCWERETDDLARSLCATKDARWRMPSLGTKCLRLCWSTCQEPAFFLLLLVKNIVSPAHRWNSTFSVIAGVCAK